MQTDKTEQTEYKFNPTKPRAKRNSNDCQHYKHIIKCPHCKKRFRICLEDGNINKG